MRKKPVSAGKGWDFSWSLSLFAGLAVLNAFLVSPYLNWYDSGEIVGATVCLGISHPSGQVLFHLLGKLFLLLPFQTPAFRLGLCSVACSALASVIFFNLSLRLAGNRIGPRIKFWMLLLTLGWSLSQPWWRYSLTPLVYALHLLLGMMVLWALSLEKPGKWSLVFLILGAAVVFRPTQYFALPFVGIAFLREWIGEKGRSLKWGMRALVFFLLGWSTALYLPLRSALRPELAYGNLTSLPSFLRHLFALRFSHYVGRVSASSTGSVLHQMLSHFWNDLTPLGLGLLAVGLAILAKNRKKIPIFLWVGIGWALLEGLFVFTIPFPTFESHQVLLGWAFSGFLGALALSALDSWAGRDRARSLSVGLLLVFWVLVQTLSLGHFEERKGERGAQDYARNILDLLPPGSLYIPTEENEYFPVVGYQQSFRYKKDVEVLEPGTPPALVAPRIRECMAGGRPLYVSRKWELPPGWSFQAVGPLLRVGRFFPEEVPEKLTGPWKPLALWGKIGLVKADVIPDSVRAGGRVEITYQWARLGPGPCDDTDSVVALFSDKEGNFWMKNGVFWLHDIHPGPLGRLSRMKPGYEYGEKRILFIPSDYPPGRYRLEVALQRSASPKEVGSEVYGKEFYERGSSQDLGKFMGRGEEGAVVQFSALASQTTGIGFWPLTRFSGRAVDTRFAPAAELEILPPGD